MKDAHKDGSLAFQPHNHEHCRASALQRAHDLCQSRQVRLTQRRQQVLELLLDAHKPMGAYDLLQVLNQSEQNIMPPIVYRALEFLQEQGLVHRIESQNTFIACDHPGHGGNVQFFICQQCERVAEVEQNGFPAQQQAEHLGFQARTAVVEVAGICAECQHRSHD